MGDEENVSIKAVLVIFSIFLLMLVGYVFSENRQQEKMLNRDQSTIGYVHRIDWSGKNSDLKYYFYVDSLKFLSESRAFDVDCLHKYYVVKYNSKNPKENALLLDQEINPDSLSLVKAGFKKKKNYYYDNVTSTYKEKSEWR
jgi:hypothetical protein